MFACLIVLIMFYRFFFKYIFISNNCSFNVYADIEASSSQSMTKRNPVPDSDQPPPF